MLSLSTLSSQPVLRAVCWLDALTGLLLGALHLALSSPLADWLGLPEGLLQAAGLALLGYAALAILVARAPHMPKGLLWALVLGNWAWVAGCLVLLLGSGAQPTVWGQAYLLVHVVAVAALAELQWTGVRRLPGLAAAA